MRILIAIGVLCSYASAATICGITKKAAPAVTTLMTATTDPMDTVWVVKPNCDVETIVARADGDVLSLACGLRGIEYVESIPSEVNEIYLFMNPLSKGGDLTAAYGLKLAEFVASPSATVLHDVKLPDSVTSILTGKNKMQSLEGVKLPSSLKFLGLGTNDISSLSSVVLPDSLTELELSDNKIAAVDFAMPRRLQKLSMDNNPVTTFTGAAFPDSLTTISCNGCSLTSLRGVVWPNNLQNLMLAGNNVQELEIRESDLLTFKQLQNLTVPVSQTTCRDTSAKLTKIRTINACVISDARFNQKYRGSESSTGSGSSGSSAKQSDSASRDSDSSETPRTPTTSTGNVTAGSADGQTLVGAGSTDAHPLIIGNASSPKNNHATAPSMSSGTSDNSRSAGVPASSASSDSRTPTLLIAIVVIGVVLILAVGAIAHRVFIVPRRRSDERTKADKTYNSADTPHSTSASNSTSTSSQEYLMNDVRNDKEIIKRRVELSEVRIGQVIARGGYGVIYLGIFKNSRVAIKQMLPGTWHNDAMLSSFMAEIRMCARLDHPKIVSFLGVAWSSLQDLSVIIEYMPGGDLHALLHKQPVPTATRTATRTAAGTGAEAAQTGSEASVGTGPRSQDWTQPWTPHNIKPKTAIAMDIAEAVVYLHSFSSPILHRDLKTRNVLLDRHGNAKLSDFGISRELTLDETMTSEIGTAAWIAPEVLRGERYGEKADIYSLGVVLVELDRCRHPYADEKVLRGESTMAESTATGMAGASGSSRGSGRGSNGGGGGGRQSMSHVAHKNTQIAVLVSTGKLRPSVSACCPETVSSLVSRCLAFDADARPTAMEVYYELRQFLRSCPWQRASSVAGSSDLS